MYSNVGRSRMCQDTLGPNGPDGPIARGYAWHSPNIRYITFSATWTARYLRTSATNLFMFYSSTLSPHDCEV